MMTTDFSISDTFTALVQQDSYSSISWEAPSWWNSDLGGYGPSALIAQMNCSGLSWSNRVCKAVFNFSGVAVDYIVNYAHCPNGICDEEDEFTFITESCERGPNIISRVSESAEDRSLPFLREIIKNGTSWNKKLPFPDLCGGEDYQLRSAASGFTVSEVSSEDLNYTAFLFMTLLGVFGTHACILQALKSESQEDKVTYGLVASVSAVATIYLGSYLF